jgi:hypothetical protein
MEATMTVAFKVNGNEVAVDAPGGTPLLWIIREYLMHGTRFGCGAGLCGACMVQSTATELFPVKPFYLTFLAGQSRRSKVCQPIPVIRCKRRGSRSKCHNAGTANPGKS